MSDAIRSVLATKQYGYEDILTKLVVDACLTTFPANGKPPQLLKDNVRIAKLRGGSIPQSTVIRGMVLLRDAESLIKKVENGKACVFGCGIEAASPEAKGTVLIKNAEELQNYNKSEEKNLEEIIAGIAATGVKLLICNGSISEMALHFIDKYELMVVKVVSKFDLRRICGALGAVTMVRLAPPTPEEMGSVKLAEVRELGGRKVVVLSQDQDEDTSI